MKESEDMKITHEDRLVWGDVARVFPPPREMFERVRCLLGALEETEAELAKERERSKKIAVEAAGYATEVEDLKARLADAKANACGRVQVIDPGEGWRLLRAGEKIEKGDELHFDDGAWEESLDVGLIHLGGDETPKPRRRRVAAPPPADCRAPEPCGECVACLRRALASEREEVVRLDKELGRERANADAALKSMNEQALAQHRRIVELEAALNGTLHAESDEHDASMRQWEERHPAGAGAIALGPRKSKPPCKTPFQPKDIVVEAEVTPKGEHRSGYVAIAGEPQEAK